MTPTSVVRDLRYLRRLAARSGSPDMHRPADPSGPRDLRGGGETRPYREVT